MAKTLQMPDMQAIGDQIDNLAGDMSEQIQQLFDETATEIVALLPASISKAKKLKVVAESFCQFGPESPEGKELLAHIEGKLEA